MYYDVIMTGFGGQGIQTISQIFAIASINRGLEVTFLPSYGVEKRGGRTNVTVIVSDEEIGSPITNTPKALIAMDAVGLRFFQDQLQDGSLLIANTSLAREDLITFTKGTVMKVRFNEEAVAIGGSKLANMITLGAFIGSISFLTEEDIAAALRQVTPERLKETIPENLKAISRGVQIAEEARRHG